MVLLVAKHQSDSQNKSIIFLFDCTAIQLTFITINSSMARIKYRKFKSSYCKIITINGKELEHKFKARGVFFKTSH